MIITQIEKQKKDENRCSIYIDGVFYCGLTLEAVVTNKLAVGKEIEKSQLDEIQLESEKQTALNKTVKYISKAMKTEKEIKNYLFSKGYTYAVINFVLDKLKEYKFVDDETYVNLYIKQSSKNKGKKRIKFELKNKGVDEKLVMEKVSEIDTDRDSAMELGKKYLNKKTVDEKTKEKLFRYLAYRGFSTEDILYVLRTLIKGDDNYD